MNLSYGMKSDTGLVRRANEDSCYSDPHNGLFIVADGMGGHVGGHVASKQAVKAFVDYLRDYFSDPDITPPNGLGMDPSAPETVLRAAMVAANSSVFRMSMTKPSLKGMGTTLSAAWLSSGCISVAHVGDSRVYLIRDGALNLLTHDHSWVYEQYREGVLSLKEVRAHPMKHLVTRSLGAKPHVQTDIDRQQLRKGDQVLLCTDGLTSAVEDSLILASILNPAFDQPSEKCDALVELANNAGGYDNTTVILIQVLDINGD